MTRLVFALTISLSIAILSVIFTPFAASAQSQCDTRANVISVLQENCAGYQRIADASGDEGFVGRSVLSIGFCRSEEAATILAERVAENGDEAYRQVMSDPKVDCLDMRFPYYLENPAYRRPFRATLAEFLWRGKHRDGSVYLYFWANDVGGERAIVWQKLADLQGPGA